MDFSRIDQIKTIKFNDKTLINSVIKPFSINLVRLNEDISKKQLSNQLVFNNFQSTRVKLFNLSNLININDLMSKSFSAKKMARMIIKFNTKKNFKKTQKY